MERATSTAVNADTSRLENAAKDTGNAAARFDRAQHQDLERLYGSRYFGSERASAEGSTVAARPWLASALARETYRLALRHFFLGIADPSLRRRLIAREREFHRLYLSCRMTDLQLARDDLARIEARRCAGIPWFAVGGFILAIAAGVLNVACGVVIAVVTALAWGWSCLVERRRAHSEIVAARANVARWEAILEGERLRGELFTESEARTGERDEASGRGRVVTRFERRSR